MAHYLLPLPLKITILYLLCFFDAATATATATTTTLAQVPANKTFKFVNRGEFGDRIVEYDANYRLIRDDRHTFLTFPFRLCFYNTTPDAHIFAIGAGSPNQLRWVWDANRNKPVRENATLSFGQDGNFVLADFDGRVVWQTNTANKGVTGIKLLPNGNLVLFDRVGRFIWQSFDHPTDTLLVGQSLRINGPDSLIGRTSKPDPRNGKYTFAVEENGIPMLLNKSGNFLLYGGWINGGPGSIVTFNAVSKNNNPVLYELALKINQDRPSPTGRRRLLHVRPVQKEGWTSLNKLNHNSGTPPQSVGQRRDLHRLVGNADQIILSKLNYNATYSFLRLDSDGNLRAHTFIEKRGKVSHMRWEESFAYFSRNFVNECYWPEKCGSYGICDMGKCVACPTPIGLSKWSQGCTPPKVVACGSRGGGTGGKARYYKIVGVEHFFNTLLGDGVPLTVGECKDVCSSSCTCLGFTYNENTSTCQTVPHLGTLIKDVNTSVGYIKY